MNEQGPEPHSVFLMELYRSQCSDFKLHMRQKHTVNTMHGIL